MNNSELKVKLIMAVRDYQFQKREEGEHGIDFTATDSDSDSKILLRIINDPHTKSGVVGVRSIREMVENIEEEDYDKGMAIGGRFSAAAKRVMGEKDIEMVSNKFMPTFKPKNLYFRLQEYVDELCEDKCGNVPETESECEGYSQGDYSCQIRLISDNAAFHFKRGWVDLLQKDFIQLLEVGKAMKEEKAEDTDID